MSYLAGNREPAKAILTRRGLARGFTVVSRSFPRLETKISNFRREVLSNSGLSC